MQPIWDDDIATKYAPVDNDHQAVVHLMTAYLQKIETGNRVLADDALVALTARTAQHFAFEEKLMAQSGYLQIKDHTAAHASFISDLQRSQKELRANGVSHNIRQWAFGRMVSWFRFHIKAYDIGLVQTIVAHEQAHGSLCGSGLR
jgi:hemerythrin